MVWGYPGLQRYRVTYGFVFGEQSSSLTWGSHTGSSKERGAQEAKASQIVWHGEPWYRGCWALRWVLPRELFPPYNKMIGTYKERMGAFLLYRIKKKKNGGKNDVAIRCGKNGVCHMISEKWGLNYVVGRIMLKIWYLRNDVWIRYSGFIVSLPDV